MINLGNNEKMQETVGKKKSEQTMKINVM